MQLSPRAQTAAGGISPRRRFTPRAPFDREQWMERTVRRREEEWRTRNSIIAMQAFGCDRKKMAALEYKEYVAGVTAFKAGGDAFRTFKGLPPLSARGSPRRILRSPRRLEPMKTAAPVDKGYEHVDHALEMYREGNAMGGYYQFDGTVDKVGEYDTTDEGVDPNDPEYMLRLDKEIREARRILEDLVNTKWEVLRKAFFAIDEDRSGKISRTEFLRVLMYGNLGHVIREGVISHIIDEIDTNKNGQIDYNEFVAMYSR